MSRLFLILVFAVTLANGQQRPPLPDQITDDEDDLAADMPQNGPDVGSGMEAEDPEGMTEEPQKLSTAAAPAPELEPEEITTGREESEKTPLAASTMPQVLVLTTASAKDEKAEASSPAPLPSTGLSTPALIGVIAAVIVAILLIVVIITCLMKRSRKQSRHSPKQQQQQQTTRGREQVPQEI